MICDPGMISSDGKTLLDDDGIAAVKEQLIPLAKWLTVNTAEAALLSGEKIANTGDLSSAAGKISDKFGVNVIVKGSAVGQLSTKGRLPRMTDVICRNGELWKISSLKVDLPDTASYGAGCTLSAALAAAFALDIPWKEAVCAARAFVMGSLVENIRIGKTLHAMYPPTNDYMSSIQLEKLD